MMVDIHCHILYGVEDGPKTIEEAVVLSRKLTEKGVSKVIATPHFIGDYDLKPTPECVNKLISQLNGELHNQGIELSIYPGMEGFASDDTVDRIKNGEILTLNNSKYVLIEFSFENIPKYMSNLLFSMQLEGYIPIIAHPERYSLQYRRSGIIKEAVEKGALIQVNSGSLMGYHGKEVRKEAIRLIKEGMVHLIANDAHGGKRPIPSMKDVEKVLIEICGTENTDIIFYKNPVLVFENKEVERMKHVSKGSFLIEMLRSLRPNM